LLSACKPSTDVVRPSVSGATPGFGPLAGGTIVELTGSGFLADAAAPDHVLVSGVESPLASVVDDGTLQFVVPPGVAAGDAVIDVFNQNGDGSAAGIFHYSEQPSITSLSPTNVLYSSGTTTVTVTGSGFKDENAGRVSVFIDGAPGLDVDVQSDTQLTFIPPTNQPLVTPTVQVSDERGSGSLAKAFRYVPGVNPGLLLFPNDGTTFFTYFDPVGGSTVTVPLRVTNGNLHFRSIVAHPDGTFYALRSDGVFGELDLTTQDIAVPLAMDDLVPAAAEIGGTIYGISASRNRLISIDDTTGMVTAIGSASFDRGTAAIAADAAGSAYYVGPDAGGNSVALIDLATGIRSGSAVLSPNVRVAEMRFLGGVLYAASNNNVITIDTGSGATTVVKAFNSRITAMEVFQ
jgi:hypothetical protein